MSQILSYIAKASPIHALDARVKLGLLLLFSIALFCMRTWIGLGIFAAILLGVMVASRVPLKNYGRVLLPALAILIVIWVCNSIPFDAARSLNALMYVVRISLVIVASFVITFTTTSTQLTDALASILRPLRALKVPVDDIAFTLSLALRFIRTAWADQDRADFTRGSVWIGLLMEASEDLDGGAHSALHRLLSSGRFGGRSHGCSLLWGGRTHEPERTSDARGRLGVACGGAHSLRSMRAVPLRHLW